MAPTVTESLATLVPRYTCYSYNRNCDRGGFYYWGRWVVAGIAILFFFLVLLSCCCVARRRRRRGVVPVYGTGWMAPNGKFGGGGANNNGGYPMNNYQNGQNQGGHGNSDPYAQPNPPPAYGAQQPQYTGTTFNPGDGYYGNQQQNGIQNPGNVYQRDNVYPPPPGPPPAK